jgi:hypothetical protein
MRNDPTTVYLLPTCEGFLRGRRILLRMHVLGCHPGTQVRGLFGTGSVLYLFANLGTYDL